MKTVIDTNVIVSGIFFNGKPRELLRLENVLTENMKSFALKRYFLNTSRLLRSLLKDINKE